MNKIDIILCGVGGQGILSIATVIGEAATASGLKLKQAEVHGMSQRGGDVQSNLRLSTEEIHSDLIPMGAADMIISMEPMEALRYVPYLSKNGWIVTASKPYVNIPNYPDETAIRHELDTFPHVSKLDIETIALSNKLPKSSNMILLGMAARNISIIDPSKIREAIATIFASKGESVVAANQKAFDLGFNAES